MMDARADIRGGGRASPLRRYVLLTGVWLSLLLGLSGLLNGQELTGGYFTVLVGMVPATITLIYLAAISRIDLLHKLSPGSRTHWMLSGFVLRIAIAVIVGLIVATSILMTMVLDPGWLLRMTVLLEAALVAAFFLLFRRLLSTRLVGWYGQSVIIRCTIGFAALASTLCFVLLSRYIADVPTYPTLVEALQEQPQYTGQSALMGLLFLVGGTATAWSGWLAGIAGDWDEAAWTRAVLLGFGLFGFFAGIATSFAAFMLPRSELRRLIVLEAADEPSPPTKNQIAVAGLVVLGLIGGAVPWAISASDRWLKTLEIPQRLTTSIEFFAVKIDGNEYLVPADAITNARKMATSYAGVVRLARWNARASIQCAFLAQRANVDRYLDWHYSLTAEYLRIASLFAPNPMEAGIATASQIIGSGIGTSVELRVGQFAGLAEGQAEVEKLIGDYLRNSAVKESVAVQVPVKNHISLKDLLAPSLPAVPDNQIRKRLATSIGAGTAGGFVAAIAMKSIGRIAAARASSVGASLIGRAATPRIAGLAGGAAAAGAALTAPFTGAAILGTAAAAEALMLKRQEALQRPELRRQILIQMSQTEQALLAEFDRTSLKPATETIPQAKCITRIIRSTGTS